MSSRGRVCLNYGKIKEFTRPPHYHIIGGVKKISSLVSMCLLSVCVIGEERVVEEIQLQ